MTEHTPPVATVAVDRPQPVWARLPTLVGYLLVFGMGAAAVAPFSATQTGGTSSSSSPFDASDGGTSGTSGTSSTGTSRTDTTGISGTGGTGTSGVGATATGTTGAGATGSSGSGTTGTGPNATGTRGGGPQRFASDVGVTKDVIKIGYININCKTCASINIPSSAERGNYAKAYAADINARGGINGRKVELYVSEYDPVADALNGSGGEHKSCIDLTENVKIWVFIGFSINETECIAGDHKTPMIGENIGVDDPKDFNRLGGRVWSFAPSPRRTIVDWVAKLDSLNLLRGSGTKFSVVYTEFEEGAAATPVQTYLLPLLKARGLTPTRVKNLGTDIGQWKANIAQEVPAQKALGITHVLFASNYAIGADWLDESKRDQFFPQYLVSDFGGNADENGAWNWEKNNSDFTGAIGISTESRTDDLQRAATPVGKACIDTWKKQSRRAVPDGDTSNLIGVCLDFMLFERAAKAAGANPKRADWIQAMARAGTFDNPLVAGGSGTFGVPYPFGPVRWSATDRSQASVFKAPCPRKQLFDDAKNRCWVPIGPIQKMAA